MSFINLTVTCQESISDILQALLANIGFDAFLSNETGFEASIDKELFEEAAVRSLLENFKPENELQFSFKEVEKENWNKLWESNYPYVEINEDCIIRASFHQLEKSYQYDIIITPKMSFGTGHHATTSLMINSQLEHDFRAKTVLDAGCGTGVLAIMAKKLGAAQVDAYDIDEWAVLNTQENIAVNQVDIQVSQGTIQNVEILDKYDIILANINRNVLLEELPSYSEHMHEQSLLIMSGFYTKDIEEITQKATSVSLIFQGQKEKNGWVSLTFSKA